MIQELETTGPDVWPNFAEEVKDGRVSQRTRPMILRQHSIGKNLLRLPKNEAPRYTHKRKKGDGHIETTHIPLEKTLHPDSNNSG